MSEESIPLAPVREPTTDDDSAPFIGTEKHVKRSIGIHDAVSRYITRIFSLSSLQLLALCSFCGAMLSLHILAILKWPKGDYGIGVLQENFHCGSRGVAFMTFLISIPLNLFATLVAYSLGRVVKRTCSILRVIAFLTIIPTHFLYNSVFFQSTSAYDAYEILVSNDFIYHNTTPFNPSILPVQQTISKYSPLQQTYNMSLPNLDNVDNSILQLQTSITSNKTQTQWTNLTFKNCIKRYQEGTYESFSNVVLISNWTSPSDSNNSALELTLLSGQTSPKHRVDQSLVSLCPKSFFSKYNQTDPQEWKYVSSGANGLFDPYAPKGFPVKTENVFIHSCFSQEVPQRCRLLYSPLVLRIATVCLMITTACLILSIFLGQDGDDLELVPKEIAFFLGGGIVFVAFFVQFFLTAFGSVQREPGGKNDSAWLLNAFCIVNVVQLIDTICADLFMSTHLNALKYTPFSILWHVFLSGVFSMQLSDRYIFSASPPGTTIFPITNLSSLWCKVMFKWLLIAEMYNPLPLPIVWIFALLLFCCPFALRLAAQQSLEKSLGKSLRKGLGK